MKDQYMSNVRLSAIAVLGTVLTLSTASMRADSDAIVVTGFTNSPAQSGWVTFGESSLFSWNNAAQSVDVTWDSSKTNSYLYMPLGTVLNRTHDFKMSFDLTINDVAGDFMEIAVGLMNLRDATNSAYLRATGSDSLNFIEVDYFPPLPLWFYDGGFTTTLSASNIWYFSSWGNSSMCFGSADWVPDTTPIHFEVEYIASSNAAITTVEGSGTRKTYTTKLDPQFTDFEVDAFAIKSYYGDPVLSGSILAHGSVKNISVAVKPVQSAEGAFASGTWQSKFNSLTNWNYLLLRSTNLQDWAECSPTVGGTGANRAISDTNAVLPGLGFYRVKATPAK